MKFQNPEAVREALATAFGKPAVLVVGDVMLDEHSWGDVSRISPEAPVPVVRVVRETDTAGGAGNVAVNLAGLGVRCSLAGYVGADKSRTRFLEILHEKNINATAITTLSDRRTTTKTRIIGGHQQMLRIDIEDTTAPPESGELRLITSIRHQLTARLDAIILSDYGKGALTPTLCQWLIMEAQNRGIPILVDPKGKDYGKYSGATTISPNRAELAHVTNTAPQDIAGLLTTGEALRQQLGLQFLTLTRSEDGISLVDEGGVSHFPALAREVFDVSGAGDTVIATLAAGLAAGLDRRDAIALANHAAGIVVGKVGTVPISLEELHHAVLRAEKPRASIKLLELGELAAKIVEWRNAGEKIVFTNGCFDILHAGHVTYLEQAAEMGDRLIVGLNTDASVRLLKGAGRPVNNENARATVLGALASVDGVVLFDDLTPISLIRSIRPDILAKGGDYTRESIVGADEVHTWGGEVTIIPLVPGHSSTKIIEIARGNSTPTREA